MIVAFLPPARRLCACALFLGATLAHADDWTDTLSRKAGTFPAPRPLTAHYDFGWSGLKAAEADTTFGRIKGGKLELDITGRTVGAARLLWRIDAQATSVCRAATLHPVKLQQTETYASKKFTTTVDFTATGPASLRVVEPPDPTKPKVKRFKFAEVHDLQSALLFIRSQPLKNGDTTRLCVFPANSAYLAEVKVTGREKVKAAGRTWPAIRCDLKLQSVDKDLKLSPHRRFKRATAWISDDPDRLLLRIDADVFVGNIWLEMKKVEFAKK